MMTLDFRNRVFKKRITDRSMPNIPETIKHSLPSTSTMHEPPTRSAGKQGFSKEETQRAIEILRRD